MQKYIIIGKLDKFLMKKINIKLITEEVIFTFERIKHVQDRRKTLYEEVKDVLPKTIYEPDYIYKDWNNRNNTLVFIKDINDTSKLNVVIKIAISDYGKYSRNSVITMIKIGEKTFRKIYRNKSNNLLFKSLDKQV